MTSKHTPDTGATIEMSTNMFMSYVQLDGTSQCCREVHFITELQFTFDQGLYESCGSYRAPGYRSVCPEARHLDRKVEVHNL